MSGDTILLIILAVGTLLLNREFIRTEWFSVRDKQEEQS